MHDDLELDSTTRDSALHFGTWSAAITLVGIALSGPVSLWAVGRVHPQPPWNGPEAFIENYHWVQTLPYWAGYALVAGYTGLIASLHCVAPRSLRARTTAALMFGSAFTAFIFLNYTLQATLLPRLTRHDAADLRPAIALLSMSNPASLGWALEMWGYALLGVATWLVAPTLSRTRLERWASRLLWANGVVSVAGALWAAGDPGWETTPAGMIAFVSWNVLAFAMSAATMVALIQRSGVPDSARRPSVHHANAPVRRA